MVKQYSISVVSKELRETVGSFEWVDTLEEAQVMYKKALKDYEAEGDQRFSDYTVRIIERIKK